MVEFADTETLPGGKKVAEQFVAVRQRGMLNAGLDVMAEQVKRANPGMECRWERYSDSKDDGKDAVVMSEGMGWKLCSYENLGMSATDSTPKSGMIRRGDLVLMMAPKELAAAWLAQDAEAAQVDSQAPKAAFEDALAAKQVRLSSGDTDRAKGVGQIKVRTEQVQAPITE